MLLLLWLALSGCGLGPPRFSDSHASDRVPLRVLPIGDSYTSGYLSVGGWRPFVRGVDFVGPFCDEVLVDCEHAGIGGRRLDEMAADAPRWIAEYAPDVVVLWGGYNDVTRGASAEEAVASMAALVEAVLDSGAVPLVVTTFRPHTTQGDAVDAFSAALRTRASADGWRVADVRATTDDSATWIECTDNVHPTFRGYEAAGRVIEATLP